MPLISVDGLPSLNLVGRYCYDVVVLLAVRDKNISAVLRLVLQPMGYRSVDFSIRSQEDIGVGPVISNDIVDVAKHLLCHGCGENFIRRRVICVAPLKIFAATAGTYILAEQSAIRSGLLLLGFAPCRLVWASKAHTLTVVPGAHHGSTST